MRLALALTIDFLAATRLQFIRAYADSNFRSGEE